MKKTDNQVKNNKALGNLGEKLALHYLLKKDYKHIASNYQGHWCELDLIMEKDQRFIFVEVKTRQNTSFGPGEEAVDHHKKRKLLRAIHQFIGNNILINKSTMLCESAKSEAAGLVPPQRDRAMAVMGSRREACEGKGGPRESGDIWGKTLVFPQIIDWQLDLVSIEFIGFRTANIRHFENILGEG